MAAPGDYLKRTTVRPWHQHAASSEKIAPAPINALALRPTATPGRRIPGAPHSGPATSHPPRPLPHAAGRGPAGRGRGARAGRGAAGRARRAGPGVTSHVCGAGSVRFVRVFMHQIRDRSAQPSPGEVVWRGNRGFADGDGCWNYPNRPRSASHASLAPEGVPCAPRPGAGELSAGFAGRRTPRRPPATRSWRPRRPPGPGQRSAPPVRPGHGPWPRWWRTRHRTAPASASELAEPHGPP